MRGFDSHLFRQSLMGQLHKMPPERERRLTTRRCAQYGSVAQKGRALGSWLKGTRFDPGQNRQPEKGQKHSCKSKSERSVIHVETDSVVHIRVPVAPSPRGPTR